ncbi:hypothetical protein K3728_12800 [Rhodobacteraceae bacterium M385]|nr:hypothetical protein K3728_12800 [Rhodobacteraceae bacterium M385]
MLYAQMNVFDCVSLSEHGWFAQSTRFTLSSEKEGVLAHEKLLSPKELSSIVGLSVAQVRALMNSGKLEFVEISPKTKLLTMSGWDRFQKNATKVKGAEGSVAN